MDKQDKIRLNSLRNQIRDLDTNILEQISERLSIAKEIGLIKKKYNLPIKNQEVEDKIFNRIRDLAPKLDLPTEVAIKIMTLLISESISTQERDKRPNSMVKSDHRGKNFLIIGGLGKMGNWLANLLLSLNHSVDILDKVKSSRMNVFDTIPELSNYDFIAICTPLIDLNTVIRKIIDQKPEAVIFDMGSLKSHILDEIKYGIEQGLNITSVHPLFGPNINILFKKNFLLCSCGSDFADKTLKEIFAPTSMNFVEIPIKDHDRYMSISLGLSHALNIIFGHVIHNSGLNEIQLHDFASTTFMKQLKTAKEVFSENIEMYHSIQHLNINRDQLYDTIYKSAKFVHKLVNNESIKEFSEFADSIKKYFSI